MPEMKIFTHIFANIANMCQCTSENVVAWPSLISTHLKSSSASSSRCWVPAAVGGIHVLMFSFTGKSYIHISQYNFHFLFHRSIIHISQYYFQFTGLQPGNGYRCKIPGFGKWHHDCQCGVIFIIFISCEVISVMFLHSEVM